jgi:phenylalanyl-tRNA synthetase beta chain
VDNYARRIQPANIRLRPRRVNRLLGTNLNSQTIADCLSRLGMEVKKTGLEHEVTVPTFRPDLIEEIDLVEEIIRIYGYNRVKTAKRADISLEVEPLPEEETDQIIKSALVELGLDEVLTYGMRAANREGLDKTAGVAIRNPLSYDFAFLRSDLLAPLLEVVAHNLNHGAESVRIFELGHIFSQSTPIKVEERKQLAGILAGKVQNTFWGAISEEFDFFYLKGMVEDFLRKAALDNYQFTPYIKDDNYFEDAQKVLISGEEAGAFGELKREIIRGFDIEIPVFCFHFDYQVLSRCWQVIRPFIPYSRQPAVKRDLSVVIDEGISSQEIEKSVYENGSEYLTKLEFFDLYRGAQLGAGKKSLSLALKFQAPERTLTDTEVDEVINQIVSGLHKLGGVLRSK